MKTLLQYYYFFFFLFFNIATICVNIIPGVHSLCIQDQQLLLLHLKKSLTFHNESSRFSSVSSTRLISWNSSTDCCSWIGVNCTTDGRVVGLDISSQYISGGIDNSSSLFDLQHLQSLNLADNGFDFVSGIRPAIGKLTNLRYLNLSHNFNFGQIPIEISRLTKLVVLDISVTGAVEIPNLSMVVQNLTELTELYLDFVNISSQGTHWSKAISSSLPNLRVLSMSGTEISGPIDQSLAKLQSLSVIRLDFNNIAGPVPGFFANFSNLTVLSLDVNSISAPIPGFFANFSKLSSLSLRGCGLKGTFPEEIFQVPTLQTIDLSGNRELHGSFPDEFPKNGSLRSLDLSYTNFSGLLPDSIGNLKMLSIINLCNCSFTGSIPKSISNLTQLVHLDMSLNMLNGPISSIQWENLLNLGNLGLDHNLLEGSIPSSLFSLPLLPELVLSHNQFSGTLCEFSNVSSYLVTLDLSFNKLEGPIPVSIFNFRGLKRLTLSSNNFSAFPFNGPQQLTNLTDIDLSYNSLLILYNGTNSSYSSFPQIVSLNLASNKLKKIPGFLRNQSNLSSLDLSSNKLKTISGFLRNQSNLYSVNLASNKLKQIPGFLRNQSDLSTLDLSENQIEGKIPHWIWSFTGLYTLNLSCNSLATLEAPSFNSTTVGWLDVHSNQLQGKLSSFLADPHYLDYSKNNFSSSIPTDIGDFFTANTYFLSLSSNNLQGPIPLSICNGGLRALDLSNNSLSGMVPQCLSAMGLEVLNLRRNNLSGAISNFEFPYCGLNTLNLGENQIKGQFPKSVANCTRLEVLNLGNNHLADTFPCFLKNISTLHVLNLRSNKFYGSIGCPKTYGTWPMLQIIDLAHNNLSGEIPKGSLTTWRSMMANKDNSLAKVNFLEFSHELGRDGVAFSFEDGITVTSKGSVMDLAKILTVFTLIDFSCNNFSGSIPKEMGQFKSLYILNLSSNAFIGEIPSSFGNMRQLESLDLSQNKLSGQIPTQLANLSFLAFLNLSSNRLVGRIPTGTQLSTFPKESFTGNKGLWGPPLTADNRTRLSSPLTVNGSLPKFGHHEINWGLISVEIGYTFGFAIAIGSLVFCKRWSKWYYKAMYNILLKVFPQLEERIGIHRRHVHINQRWRRG